MQNNLAFSRSQNNFMREYFRAYYEDPIGVINKSSHICNKLDENRICNANKLQEELEKRAPELVELYSEIIDATLKWEDAMAEEAYIKGVQDRDRALNSQR